MPFGGRTCRLATLKGGACFATMHGMAHACSQYVATLMLIWITFLTRPDLGGALGVCADTFACNIQCISIHMCSDHARISTCMRKSHASPPRLGHAHTAHVSPHTCMETWPMSALHVCACACEGNLPFCVEAEAQE